MVSNRDGHVKKKYLCDLSRLQPRRYDDDGGEVLDRIRQIHRGAAT